MKILNAKRFAKIYFTFILMLIISTFFMGEEANAENTNETQQASATNHLDVEADTEPFTSLN